MNENEDPLLKWKERTMSSVELNIKHRISCVSRMNIKHSFYSTAAIHVRHKANHTLETTKIKEKKKLIK